MITLPIWIYLGIIIIHGAFRAQADVLHDRYMGLIMANDQCHRADKRMLLKNVVEMRSRKLVSDTLYRDSGIRARVLELAQYQVRAEIAELAKAYVDITLRPSDYEHGIEVWGSLKIWRGV
jgi:hypothetical protein